jgi:hypothetical protein
LWFAAKPVAVIGEFNPYRLGIEDLWLSAAQILCDYSAQNLMNQFSSDDLILGVGTCSV